MTESQGVVVKQLIENARQTSARRETDWHDYERLKRGVANLELNGAEYDVAVQSIARELKLA